MNQNTWAEVHGNWPQPLYLWTIPTYFQNKGVIIGFTLADSIKGRENITAGQTILAYLRFQFQTGWESLVAPAGFGGKITQTNIKFDYDDLSINSQWLFEVDSRNYF
jgi:hypothetical protein